MADLNRSISAWNPTRRRVVFLLLLAAVVCLSILVGSLWMENFFIHSDVGWYLNIAHGDIGHTMMPFASRQLGPLAARGLAHLLHSSIETGFLAEGVLSLLIFAGTTLFLLERSGAPRWMLLAIAGLFFWPQQFNGLALPDLFYAALLCVFLLLYRGNVWAAALLFLPLSVCRESTMLTLVCFLLAGWRRLRLVEAAVAIAATVAGMAVVKHLSAGAMANAEHIPPFFYLLAKMPWNFVRNFLGLNLWANLYRFCDVPKWQIPLHLGPLRAIGICSFNPEVQAYLLSSLLTSFGLLPLVLWRVRRANGRSIAQGSGPAALMLRFCIVYGTVSFVLAPLLGESFVRLFAYAWPVFLVGLPVLAASAGVRFQSAASAAIFLTLHLLLSWAPVRLSQLPLTIVAVVLFALGYLTLRKNFQTGSPPALAVGEAPIPE